MTGAVKQNNLEPILAMRAALQTLCEHKPRDRSDMDRDYQIVITEMEMLIAFFEHRVVEGKR